MDGELRIEAEAGRIFAQQPRANGVERSRIGRRRRGGRLRREKAGEQPLHAAAKLRRSAAGEGGEHDALRIDAREDKRRHPMRQHRGLARARARDDKQRSRPMRIADPVLDPEPLLGIEIDGRARANQGERHGSTQPRFAVCSQGPTRQSELGPCSPTLGVSYKTHRRDLSWPIAPRACQRQLEGPVMGGAMPGAESHCAHRTAWLRAAVLGANDGIISTASLIMGVATAAGGRAEILTATVAGWAAGAMSMAAGEYASVFSQADSEAADLTRERRALREQPV